MMKIAVVFLLCASAFAQEPACVPIKDAKELIGKQGCVVGKVERVETSSGGNVYVNFCSDYRHCPFSAVAVAKDRSPVGDLHELEGASVELRGDVSKYKGMPEMKLVSREQIKLVKHGTPDRSDHGMERERMMHESRAHFGHPHQFRVKR